MLSKKIKILPYLSLHLKKGYKLSCHSQYRLQTTRATAAAWTSLELVKTAKSQTYTQNHNLHFNKISRKLISLRSTGIRLIQFFWQNTAHFWIRNHEEKKRVFMSSVKFAFSVDSCSRISYWLYIHSSAYSRSGKGFGSSQKQLSNKKI